MAGNLAKSCKPPPVDKTEIERLLSKISFKKGLCYATDQDIMFVFSFFSSRQKDCSSSKWSLDRKIQDAEVIRNVV